MRERGWRLAFTAATIATILAVAAARDRHQKTATAPDHIPAPVGTARELGLAGYAKILCSGVFVSNRDPDEAARNSAYWMLADGDADKVTYTIDRAAKRVRATIANLTRDARFYGDQGCIITPPGKTGIAFTPVSVPTRLPAASTQPWPMGDKPDAAAPPTGLDRAKLEAAVEAAFADPAALTAAFIVVHKGRIVGERYGQGATKDTQLESWSMGKSIVSTLFALLVKDGTYTLEQPAPVPLWHAQADDPRTTIRNMDLLRMSGGLKFLGNQEPNPGGGYIDHFFIYTGAVDVFDYAINRPAEYPPNTDGRYRNCDPLTIGYLVKLAVTRRGEQYLTWPQRMLFDRIGIRRQVMETDPYGNLILTGYDYGTARNWARLGLLYLRDGVWQDERVLPEGWTRFVSTIAPAWKRPVYGGLFWINGDGAWNLPRETYLMAGAGGQNVWIDKAHDLVVVRMGHYRGQRAARAATNTALKLVIEAVGE